LHNLKEQQATEHTITQINAMQKVAPVNSTTDTSKNA